jgi:hypothetical protein
MNPRVVDPDTTTPPGVLPFSQREFALVLGALLKRLAPVEEGRPEPREVAPVLGQTFFARHRLALRSCDAVIPAARAIALACTKPTCPT